MFSQRIIVLDCGASRITLGAFSRRRHAIRLDAMATEVFPAATTGDNWLEQTRHGLQALRARMKDAAGPAVLVLPAHLALTRLVRTPRVAPAERAKIVRFEAGQSVPCPLADVVWDSAVVGEREHDLDVLLAAARLKSVEPLCAAAQSAGFVPCRILPSSLATLAGFRLLHPVQAQSSLVLNLGARSTILLLAGSGRTAVRTFLLGCGSLPPPNAGAPDRAAVDELATHLAREVTRSVLHFHRQDGVESPVCAHLAGGGARLDGLAAALAAKLKIPVNRFDAAGAVEMADAVDQSVCAAQALALTDLVGAAATRLRPDQPALNLLPPRRLERESFRRRQPWLVAAAWLAVAAMIPPLAHLRGLAVEAQRQTFALERELAPWRKREARNRDNLRQLEELRRQVAQLQGVHDRRSGWLNLLADLEDRFGRAGNVWLEKLKILPAAAGAPVKLAISGRMPGPAGTETFDRVRALLAGLVDSPFITALEGERFDHGEPGILKFGCVLVTDPQHPL